MTFGVTTFGRPTRSLCAFVAVLGVALVHCSASTAGSGGTTPPSPPSPDDAGGDAATAMMADAKPYSDDAAFCYPDGDGINGGEYTFDLTVDDNGFSKMILATQNDAQATVTLKNLGTKPHGFTVGCANVTSVYPNLPAGCNPDACFPSNATIAPLAPGASATITFDTPTPDGILYPFTSSAPGDSAVPGLNSGQWSLM